jgi:glycosyltransferase involved in cell wall biosynthesis/nucleotide-binding universal stress UspA family protein
MDEKQVDAAKTRRGRRKRRRVLVPIFNDVLREPLIALAHQLSDGRMIQVLGVVSVKSDEEMSQASSLTQELRTRVRKAVRAYGGKQWPRIIASTNPVFDVISFITGQNVSLLLLPWSAQNEAYCEIVESLLEHAPCPIALLQGSAPSKGDRILVVLRPGPDSEMALRLGLNLARSGGYTLSTLRSEGPIDDERANDDIPGINQVLEQLPQIEDAVLVSDDPVQAILKQAENFDLLIVGACETEDTGGGLHEPLSSRLFRESPIPVLYTCSRRSIEPQPQPDFAGIEAISILVDKWFAENTFSAREFENIERLHERKLAQGLTISLALPTLNEEKTVGKVIRTIKEALVDDVPLLDEIILIDSNSTDSTREIARSHGIPVYIHQDILPQYGKRHGKGEALWKSLYVTRGDIVIWIDTDITNIHPHFVYGLIGPLLHRPALKYIKGFYLRPIRVGDTTHARGGGRVTELTARPLLNLFYPTLSGFIQPLSGEYGGRREVLEQLPFSCGYGVEIGLLIDILERYGLGALGQVNLIKRLHRNQPLTSLSKMSFAIIQTVIRKIDRRDGLQLLHDVNRAMKLIRHEENRFFLEVERIAELQRPPMIEIPEYLSRRGENDAASLKR